jgi:hypothetical protein
MPKRYSKIPSSNTALNSVFERLDPLVKNWAIALREHEKIHGADQSFNLLVWGKSCQIKIDAGLARVPNEGEEQYELWQDVQSILHPQDLIIQLFKEIIVDKKEIHAWEWNDRVSKILMDNGVTR